VGGGLELWPRIEMDLHLGLPVIAATRTEPEGDARFMPWQLGVGASWRPIEWLRLGTVVTGVLVQTDGVASEPQVGVTSFAATALVQARVGVSIELYDRLRWYTDTRAGAAVARVVPRFADRAVGHWGQPVFGLSTGLEMRL
jgi:hypothetical protein